MAEGEPVTERDCDWEGDCVKLGVCVPLGVSVEVRDADCVRVDVILDVPVEEGVCEVLGVLDWL